MVLYLHILLYISKHIFQAITLIHCLYFQPVGPFKVGEGSLSGATVGIVKANDLDTERNAEITFSITGRNGVFCSHCCSKQTMRNKIMFVLAGDLGNNFAIGVSSGVISTTKVLVSIDGASEVK